MNVVYFAPLSERLDQVQFKSLLSYVPEERQQKIKQYNFDIDKKLSLYSYVLLLSIIQKKLNLCTSDMLFDKNQFGRPYLKGYSNFHFNLSHTNNAITVAVSDKTVGVDIERVRPFDLKIAERFFSSREAAYVNEKMDESITRFFEIWTKKEAYVKYTGQGLSIPLHSFDVLNIDISQRIQWFNYGQYIISVCSEYTDPKFDFISLSESDIERLAMKK